MQSPKTSPKKTSPRRTVFGNSSPNLINQSTNSIFNGKKLQSPDFNVVSSDWKPSLPKNNPQDDLSTANFDRLKSLHHRHQHQHHRQPGRTHSRSSSINFVFGSVDKDKSMGKDTRSELLSLHTRHRSYNEPRSRSNSPHRLRRANTSELFDRFIPSRLTTSGKLTLDDTEPLTPANNIESQSSKVYQHTVAEACGLDVGERILQFQPAPPERQNSAIRINSTIPTTAIQARLKKVPTCPQKVLDAPGFLDDFYLNLVAWSSANMLAIALGNSIYCWNATTGNVDQLTECQGNVCSVKWSADGYYLSVGLEDGSIEIWDVEAQQKMRTMRGHMARVAATSWNQHILTAGDRTGLIIHHDVRIQDHVAMTLEGGHTVEVCGLEWRPDGLQFASGGNDNLVNIWDVRSTRPHFTKTAHNAAVKALAWCPTHSSLLATGGGSACRKIHFWNSMTGARVNTIETESQVSSLRWGYSNGVGNEIAATHGFPNNDISVYAFPSMQKTGVVLNAHESRVLSSCLSPDGTTLATVAADENLKFWKLFDYQETKDEGLAGKMKVTIR